MNQADLEKIFGEVDCSPYEFVITPLMGSGFYVIQATTWRLTGLGDMQQTNGPMVVLTPDMDHTTMIGKCYSAAQQLALQEVHDSFKWRNEQWATG